MLAELATAVAGARRPVIVAGAEAARDGAWDELVAFAERHGAPVWASPMSSRNAFPEDHPLFAGFLIAGREPIVTALAGHDLIVALGAPVFTCHVEGFGPHLPEGATLWQIIDDPALAAAAPVGTSIVGDIKDAVATLLQGDAPDRARPKAWKRPTPPAPEPLTDAYVLSRVAALRGPGSIIVEEAPSSRGPMHDFLPILAADTFYTCASGGLGYGLPASIGVALGRPSEKVIALIGDGSAMYSIQALWTAAQLKLPITFLVLNNRRYEALIGFGRRFGLDETIGTDLSGIDFVALAAAQGVAGIRIDSAATLDDALASSLSSPEPNLIEIMIA
jgi:benzoylformate decarboxylase